MNIQIPRAIQPPESFSSEALGVGVQIYVCKPKAGQPGVFEWAFKAPEADLFDEEGRMIGRHYLDEVNGGPAWELSDGSKVVGNTASPGLKRHAVPNAIPWLYVPAKLAEGQGALGQVKSIQRLVTLGGVAPTKPAPEKSREGEEVRVYYSATYYFNS